MEIITDIIDEFGVIPFLLAIVLGGWFVGQILVGLSTDAQCARLGYRDSGVTWDFSRYCATRVDQTDVVVPLATARKNPR